jgi:hypothetical protein
VPGLPTEIVFDETQHRYTHNGIIIPSVTTILAAAGLPDLSGIPAVTLQWKAELGTMVHLATELDDLGELDEDSIDDRITPYLEAYRRFKSKSGFEIIDIEKMVFDPALKYAGKLDRFGILNGKRTLLDIKTGVFDPLSVGPQTAAYDRANNDLKCNRYALQLKDDGIYKLHRLNNQNDFNIFLSALNLYRWKQGGK